MEEGEGGTCGMSRVGRGGRREEVCMMNDGGGWRCGHWHWQWQAVQRETTGADPDSDTGVTPSDTILSERVLVLCLDAMNLIASLDCQ